MYISPSQWQQMRPAERIDALQAQIDIHAAHEQPGKQIAVGRFNAGPEVRGQFDRESGSIMVNDQLINQDTPYAAMETLHHEYRHAFQDYVANERPDLATSAQQLTDFQKNPSGYIHPDTDHMMYRSQPIEVDARNYARQSMEAAYGGQQDPGYTEFRQSRDQEDAAYQQLAELSIGPDHEQQARTLTYEIHDLKQAQSHSEEVRRATEQSPDQPVSPTQEESEEQQQTTGRKR